MEYKIQNKVRLIELFAGIGSQAKALKRISADFEHYRVIEFDRNAMDSYNAIHETDFETSDITKIHAADLGIENTKDYTYIMTYSFPCQDLSKNGKHRGMQKGSGTRSGLLWEVERLLDECEELPQVLLMENVPQVHSKNNVDDFKDWIDYLESKGYTNHWKDLNAKDHGIPQNRNRCFMVSILGDYEYEFPSGIELETNLIDLIEDDVTEYIDIDSLSGLVTVDHPYIKIKEATKKGYAEAKHGDSINLAMPKSQTRRGRVGRGVAQTLLTSPEQAIVNAAENEVNIRYLTPREYWRLMGFDDEDFDRAAEINNKSQLYKQAGNSIVVDVLEAIFKQLF